MPRIYVSEIAKLVPKLKYSVKPRHRNLRNFDGPFGRICKIRQTLSALFKFERIEVYQTRADEVRGYAERLITEAIRNGDKHPQTMAMADFWLEDKQMIHKLFKVLVPRYKESKSTFTDVHLIPDKCHNAVGEYKFEQECVLELTNNPYPPMPAKSKPNRESLTNILLREASKDFKKMKLNQEKK